MKIKLNGEILEAFKDIGEIEIGMDRLLKKYRKATDALWEEVKKEI